MHLQKERRAEEREKERSGQVGQRLQIVPLPPRGILLMRYASSQNLNYFQATPPNILNTGGWECFVDFTFIVTSSKCDICILYRT